MQQPCSLQQRAGVTGRRTQPAADQHAMVQHVVAPLSRAHLLRALLLSASGLSAAALLPKGALAAESVLASESVIDSLLSSFVPPEPISFPRKRLELNFAVLLMRAGYEAVDDLDFIPMDDFQKKFWKLRQAEYQPYTLQLSPVIVKQGDLSDPNYFDFISFAQYATITREIPEGKQVFKEYCEECEGMSQLVTRDPARQDNKLLPGLHTQLTGDRIYDGLLNGFRGEQFGGPSPCSAGCSFEQALAGVQAVLDIFVAKGYCLRANISDVTPAPGGGRGGTFRVRLEGPANLWGLQSLASRRSLVYNAYDALAVAAYLRASGLMPRYKLAWSDTAVMEEWTVA